MPLTHLPAQAPADFGEAVVVIAGVERKTHFVAFDLPHSVDRFVGAFPGRDQSTGLQLLRRTGLVLSALDKWEESNMDGLISLSE